jgi:hypothetical protein
LPTLIKSYQGPNAAEENRKDAEEAEKKKKEAEEKAKNKPESEELNSKHMAVVQDVLDNYQPALTRMYICIVHADFAIADELEDEYAPHLNIPAVLPSLTVAMGKGSYFNKYDGGCILYSILYSLSSLSSLYSLYSLYSLVLTILTILTVLTVLTIGTMAAWIQPPA